MTASAAGSFGASSAATALVETNDSEPIKRSPQITNVRRNAAKDFQQGAAILTAREPPRARSSPVSSADRNPSVDQSSRSFRLGVRLGSLARKPNTKMPMKKKTTE